MRKLVTLLAFIVLAAGCDVEDKSPGYRNGGVSQNVSGDCYGLTETRSCIITYVWINKDIVYDIKSPITASKQKIQADSLKADSMYQKLKSFK